MSSDRCIPRVANFKTTNVFSDVCRIMLDESVRYRLVALTSSFGVTNCWVISHSFLKELLRYSPTFIECSSVHGKQ